MDTTPVGRSHLIDTSFNVYSDSRGKDPDAYSPTLRSYHRALWSKTLPSGEQFDLSTNVAGKYLHHLSDLGEFSLSSDSVGHTYRNVRSMATIVSKVPARELLNFLSICSTIGAYIIFPSNMAEGKMTINAARGCNRKIGDRFDLTLECIRRHYLGLESPLSNTLGRYANFFALFESFSGYCEFFLLQDLAIDGGAGIKTFLPFSNFEAPALPRDPKEYLAYRDAVVDFVLKRNDRIDAQRLRV